MGTKPQQSTIKSKADRRTPWLTKLDHLTADRNPDTRTTDPRTTHTHKPLDTDVKTNKPQSKTQPPPPIAKRELRWTS